MSAFVVEIDINSLNDQGETLAHTKWIVEPVLRDADPHEGQNVVAVDEWGVRYPAVVQSINARGFMHLMVKVDSPASPTLGQNIPVPTSHAPTVPVWTETGTESVVARAN